MRRCFGAATPDRDLPPFLLLAARALVSWHAAVRLRSRPTDNPACANEERALKTLAHRHVHTKRDPCRPGLSAPLSFFLSFFDLPNFFPLCREGSAAGGGMCVGAAAEMDATRSDEKRPSRFEPPLFDTGGAADAVTPTDADHRNTLLGRLVSSGVDHLKLVHPEDRQRVWRLDLCPLVLRGRINRSVTATAIRDERDTFTVRGTLDSGWMYRATVDTAASAIEARLEFAAPNKDYCTPIPFRAQRKEKSA
nr:hypothetical protein [Pandoravirus belohorizontensis]